MSTRSPTAFMSVRRAGAADAMATGGHFRTFWSSLRTFYSVASLMGTYQVLTIVARDHQLRLEGWAGGAWPKLYRVSFPMWSHASFGVLPSRPLRDHSKHPNRHSLHAERMAHPDRDGSLACFTRGRGTIDRRVRANALTAN